MACFWTDFVNCFEDCGAGCELFADVVPAYEVMQAGGISIAGFEDAHVDFGLGTFYIKFPSDSGITSCVITGGQTKIPTDSGLCDAGCCTTSLTPDFSNFAPGMDYHFDDNPGIGAVVYNDLPVTELVQDEFNPTQFSGPLDAIAPGAFDALGYWVTAFNVSTNLGPLCDLRFSHHGCF